MAKSTRTQEALALAEETLQALELGLPSLLPIVLRGARLARLLENTDAENWLSLEPRGYNAPLGIANWSGYAIWSGREGTKNPDGQQMYYIAPVEQIELELEIARSDLNSLQLTPIALTDSAFTDKQWAIQSAAEKMFNAVRSAREQKAKAIRQYAHIVACIRGTLHEWLHRTVTELRYGAILDDVFERTKARFDAFLEEEAPEAAKMLAMAYERADSADAEEWSQALTSCRRAMKALADVVYPPKSESVDGHAVDDAAYRNRLIQFVKENITSGSQGDFLKTDIESVINRVEALDSLASKGVHSDVDERDLELTVVHTYLLAGEILSLYQPPSEPAAKEVSQDASAQGIPQDPSDTGPPTSLPPISDV